MAVPASSAVDLAVQQVTPSFKYHQTSYQIMIVSILNVLIGCSSIVIGTVAAIKDSRFKDTNAYWSTNGGTGIWFGVSVSEYLEYFLKYFLTNVNIVKPLMHYHCSCHFHI